MIDKIQAILSLVPGAEVTVYDEKDVVWHVPDVAPVTEKEIKAEQVRLQAEYDAKEYQRLRKAEYDKLNQFEMQFDDQLNGTTTWIDAIELVTAV